MIEKDPKRTGLKAKAVVFADDPTYPEFAEPGTMEWRGWGFLLACPGCGSVSGISVGADKKSPRWLVAGGSVDDVSTLTLEPSLNCVGCCGWHGHLRGGTFVC